MLLLTLQTDFLNSVIVDLQRKNESLLQQLEAAMSLSSKLDSDADIEYVMSRFSLSSKRDLFTVVLPLQMTR